MVNRIALKAMMKLVARKLHAVKINFNVKVGIVLVSLGVVMAKSIVLRIAQMKMTVTQMAQILFASRTIFNVPMVKVAFRQHGNGNYQLNYSPKKKKIRKKLIIIQFISDSDRNPDCAVSRKRIQ